MMLLPLMLLLAAALCNHSASAAMELQRFVVSFDEAAPQQHRRLLLQQLEQHGYHVLQEGPGFLAVAHPSAPCISAAVDAAADAAPPAAAASTGWLFEGGGSKRARRLQQASEAAAVEAEAAARAAHAQHVARLGALQGASSSEADLRRHLHARPHAPSSSAAQPQPHQRRRLAAAGRQGAAASAAAGDAARDRMAAQWSDIGPRGYEAWGADVVDAMCASKDVRLGDEPGGEVLPWGIKAIGATDEALQAEPARGRAIVCIIDSGLALHHPEYARAQPASGGGMSLSGCAPGAACPFNWSDDVVGHGTHVAGTIGAPRNGLGVVGVMPRGAELHVVRVWNNTGDVSQGQGPYATDLVLAYSNCLAHLQAQQAKAGGRERINMIINMSYGSAGPLTVERVFIERASKRGDVLFVGSAGNNGSFLDLGRRVSGPASLNGEASAEGQAASEPTGQYLSYPASYRLNEVLSVANMRCDGSIEFTSQKNKAVSIAAPGMAILSSVPGSHATVRGHVLSQPPVFAKAAVQAGSTLGYLPNGFKEPRPIQGTRIGSTPLLPLSVCELRQARFRLFGWAQAQQQSAAGCPSAKGSVCLIELPGATDEYSETCEAMLKCVRGGGQGLLLWRQDKSSRGFAETDASFDLTPLEMLAGTQLNCGTRCKCWPELQAALGCAGDVGTCAAKAPPGLVISAQHAAALVAGGAAGRGEVKVKLSSYEWAYRFFDGTSMSAPHVSGAAALLWRLFPECAASDIATGLKLSAQRLPTQTSVPDYTAGYGMLRVDRAYTWMKEHSACARKTVKK